MANQVVMRRIKEAIDNQSDSLNLNYCHLESLPSEISELKNLKYLSLNYNQLISFEEIIYFTKLQKLELAGNYISYLPESIERLTCLEELIAHSNTLTSLPENIGNLVNLKTLNLHSNALVSLPEDIGDLTFLKTLHIYDNMLSRLPSTMGNLMALEDLDVHSNQLESLPGEIGNLKKLKKLNVDNNQLTQLPAEIGNAEQLMQLSLNNNLLANLPPQIGNLSSLQQLNLTKNQLESIPDQIGSLKQLYRLSLCDNLLTTIPGQIGNLESLRELTANSNQLQCLPEQICFLEKLYKLFLNDNLLKELPEKMGSLTSLYDLQLQNNQISHLPKTIGSLDKLRVLEIANNNLQDIPSEIIQISYLRMDLAGNPIDMPTNEDKSIHSIVGQIIDNKLSKRFGNLCLHLYVYIAPNILKDSEVWIKVFYPLKQWGEQWQIDMCCEVVDVKLFNKKIKTNDSHILYLHFDNCAPNIESKNLLSAIFKEKKWQFCNFSTYETDQLFKKLIEKAKALISDIYQQKFHCLWQTKNFNQDEDLQKIVLKKHNRFIGRTRELASIHAFIKSKQNILLLRGKEGIGKTKLLAKFYQQLLTFENANVFMHVVGASPASNSLYFFLYRLSCMFLEQQSYFSILYENLWHLLTQQKNSTIIILDGIDHLQDPFSWIPNEIPPQVKIILCGNTKKISLKKESYQQILLSLLPKREIKSFYKTNKEILRALINKKNASTPFYIHLFYQLRELGIKRIPDNIDKCFETLLVKLEKIYGQTLLTTIFAIFITYKNKISPSDLAQLLLEEDHLDMHSQVLYYLRDYLMWIDKKYQFKAIFYRAVIQRYS